MINKQTTKINVFLIPKQINLNIYSKGNLKMKFKNEKKRATP